MIECRTKGIPMRDGTRVDADGFHVFTLDETKHDPLEVFNRLVRSTGETRIAGDNAALDRFIAQRIADERAAAAKVRR